MAATIVLPQRFVDEVVEVEVLEVLELAPGCREQLLAHADVIVHGTADIETQQDLNGVVSLRDHADVEQPGVARRLVDRVVEIGTGWGGFAIHAAANYGCHVTTTTISKEQHAWAEKAIHDAGLEDRITLLLQDYRELEGQYDKLVSIEMIEAVGHEFHETFFRKCAELLKPSGQMLLQAITIADQQYDSYRKSVDFINRYIFPGGCLTSVTGMTATMTRVTDMRAVHVEDIGPHYARTLAEWRRRFFAMLDRVRELGYSEEFIRMWHYYLAYCEGGFAERAIGNVHMLIMRPEARPLLAEDWR